MIFYWTEVLLSHISVTTYELCTSIGPLLPEFIWLHFAEAGPLTLELTLISELHVIIHLFNTLTLSYAKVLLVSATHFFPKLDRINFLVERSTGAFHKCQITLSQNCIEISEYARPNGIKFVRKKVHYPHWLTTLPRWFLGGSGGWSSEVVRSDEYSELGKSSQQRFCILYRFFWDC